MKRLFIAGSNEEVLMGEIIEVHLTKDTEEGIHIVKENIELNPMTVSYLISIGVLQECKTKESDIQSQEEHDYFETWAELIEEQDKRIEALERKTKSLRKSISDMQKIIKQRKR